LLHNPEYRLKARSGSDRSVKRKNYARTTDKGFPSGRIYSLVLRYNKEETQVLTIKNLSNNMAFELFGSGTATRGVIGSAITNPSAGVYQFTLQNPQNVVNFEVGMTIQASATDGGAVLPILTPTVPDLGTVSSVNRSTGVIQFTVAQGTPNSTWANGNYITVQGDIPPAGGSGSGPLGATGSYLAASGFSAWLPATDPSPSDSFWGVNRSVDPTRLAGLRYDASSYSIEEGVVNALGFANREGADPDTMILSFQSYTALENALGKLMCPAMEESLAA
jgi:hypothetical protein